MELIEAVNHFIEALYALRWIIAIPFVFLGVLMLWGWWSDTTV